MVESRLFLFCSDQSLSYFQGSKLFLKSFKKLPTARKIELSSARRLLIENLQKFPTDEFADKPAFRFPRQFQRFFQRNQRLRVLRLKQRQQRLLPFDRHRAINRNRTGQNDLEQLKTKNIRNIRDTVHAHRRAASPVGGPLFRPKRVPAWIRGIPACVDPSGSLRGSERSLRGFKRDPYADSGDPYSDPSGIPILIQEGSLLGPKGGFFFQRPKTGFFIV